MPLRLSIYFLKNMVFIIDELGCVKARAGDALGPGSTEIQSPQERTLTIMSTSLRHHPLTHRPTIPRSKPAVDPLMPNFGPTSSGDVRRLWVAADPAPLRPSDDG